MTNEKGNLMRRIQLQPIIILALSLVVICVSGLSAQAQIAKQGAPRGIVSFYGSGTTQDYAPDMVVWSGKFLGQSVIGTGQGMLHYNAWDCTGEMVTRNGKVVIADGFCAVTDSDGDKINLRWEVDEPLPSPAKFKTKGTYLSGSGKYVGIQGGYNFICQAIADTGHYVCAMVGGEYQLP